MNFFEFITLLGGDQHLEWPNVERPIFWNFENSNMKITKVELFDYSIVEFVFLYVFFFQFYEHSKYIYDNLLNSKFLEFW